MKLVRTNRIISEPILILGIPGNLFILGSLPTMFIALMSINILYLGIMVIILIIIMVTMIQKIFKRNIYCFQQYILLKRLEKKFKHIKEKDLIVFLKVPYI
jgi:hypothetical protein